MTIAAVTLLSVAIVCGSLFLGSGYTVAFWLMLGACLVGQCLVQNLKNSVLSKHRQTWDHQRCVTLLSLVTLGLSCSLTVGLAHIWGELTAFGVLVLSIASVPLVYFFDAVYALLKTYKGERHAPQ